MRRRIGRKVLGVAMVVATVVPLLVLSAGPAAACSCIDSPLEERLAQADAGFRGTVIARRDLPAPVPDLFSGGTAEWTFAVDEVLKGPVGSARQVVRSGLNSAACGIEFQIGQRYLLLAYFNDDGVLSTNLCSAGQIAEPPPVTTTTAPPPTTVPVRGTPARVSFTG